MADGDRFKTLRQKPHLKVSGKVRAVFENGRDYYTRHGKPIVVPHKVADRPATEALTWHNENRYRG